MASNLGDEESLGGNRVQPLSSTTMSEQWRIEEGKQKGSITLSERLGLEDFLSLDVWRASLGELFGTAVLVFMIDTIVISTLDMDTKVPNLIMSILIAITITILLLAVFPVSGGHINPVISFSAALVGLISLSRAAIYIVAQCIGAFLGALALKAVVGSTIEDTFFAWRLYPHDRCAWAYWSGHNRPRNRPGPLARDHMHLHLPFRFGVDGF
ncbi:hypothetical protein Acr_14g0000370 [Actinidia rufa]|uniref:Uncharacterized protein n=1 Tax=Actinidia rufa TaxID=165716 RepID=A0A7J0FP24_9ERIC|nr:hypothetical protein Acr_14g0000370 [Actinidia rufa]